MLTARKKIADQIKKIVDKETTEWGVDVTAIKMQDMELPQHIKRVMAKQDEAERERRATIIRTKGEAKSAENLKKAMTTMATSGAISPRTLQTIESTASNPSSTVIFTLPTEVLSGLKQILKK